MAFDRFNGVRLRYELSGDGKVPLAMVHGSWGSHLQWNAAANGLSQSFRVLTYDRRGHSESECPSGQGSVRDDVADLAALIESLGLAPAHVIGNSFGASISLRLAAERPDLVRAVIAHEPPLFSLLAADPATAPVLGELGAHLGNVVERIASGDHSGAADRFMRTIALAPGEWEQVPQDLRQVCIDNAPTFLDETGDPEALEFDLDAIAAFSGPMLLSMGDRSPAPFGAALEKLAEAVPHAERLTFPDTGHLPHVTHPDAYVEAVAGFVRRCEG